MAATAIASTRLNGLTGVADPAGTAMDPTNGNVITNTGQTQILVDNTDTASHVVTFHTSETVEGLAVSNLDVTVAAGASEWYTNFETSVFGSQLNVTVDAGTTVKLTVLEP